MAASIGNLFMSWIIRSPLHGLMGENFAVITLKGRKTGKTISTPINISREAGGFMVVSMRSRQWWRNLADGQTANLHFGGKDQRIVGSIVVDLGEVAAGLKEYFEKNPSVAKFFAIPILPDGKPDPAAIQKVAGERVIIHLRLAA